MLDDTELSGEPDDGARQREADRLQGLIAKYRAVHERLTQQCEEMTAEIEDLQRESEEGAFSVLIASLVAERDRLNGELGAAVRQRASEANTISARKSGLEEEIAETKREMDNLNRELTGVDESDDGRQGSSH